MRLNEAGYGNLQTPFVLDQFWLDGTLTISAQGQVEFLRKLVNKSLPYHASSYERLKTVMLVESGPAYRLYAKKGWAGRSQPQVGWYVGYVETSSDTWLFALNIDIHDKDDMPKRQKVAMESLNAIGVLPSVATTPRLKKQGWNR